MFLMGLDFGGATFPWQWPKVICLVLFGIAMMGLFFLSEGEVCEVSIDAFGLVQSSV